MALLRTSAKAWTEQLHHAHIVLFSNAGSILTIGPATYGFTTVGDRAVESLSLRITDGTACSMCASSDILEKSESLDVRHVRRPPLFIASVRCTLLPLEGAPEKETLELRDTTGPAVLGTYRLDVQSNSVSALDFVGVLLLESLPLPLQRRTASDDTKDNDERDIRGAAVSKSWNSSLTLVEIWARMETQDRVGGWALAWQVKSP